MIRPRVLAAGQCLFFLMTGCAGGRIYDNGINHSYLCAVRVVRASGYQVRQQEFRKRSGKMVAARSIPDPRETLIRRGFFSRVSEVVSNAIEHSKLEFWDRDLAAVRVRTDKRVVAKFKARNGFLGLGSRKRTKVEFSIDSTDYGREEWVIKRERIRGGGREDLYRALAQCLEGERGRVLVAAASEPAPAPERAPAGVKPSEEKPPAEAKVVSVKEEPREEPVTLASAAPKQAPAAAPEAPMPPPAAPEAPSLAAPVRLTPEELEEKLEQGRKAYEAGKYDKTAELLEIAVQSDPKNPEALGYLGAAYYQLGKYPESILMYERYLEIVPGDLRTGDFLVEIRKAQKARENTQ